MPFEMTLYNNFPWCQQAAAWHTPRQQRAGLSWRRRPAAAGGGGGTACGRCSTTNKKLNPPARSAAFVVAGSRPAIGPGRDERQRRGSGGRQQRGSSAAGNRRQQPAGGGGCGGGAVAVGARPGAHQGGARARRGLWLLHGRQAARAYSPGPRLPFTCPALSNEPLLNMSLCRQLVYQAARAYPPGPRLPPSSAPRSQMSLVPTRRCADSLSPGHPHSPVSPARFPGSVHDRDPASQAASAHPTRPCSLTPAVVTRPHVLVVCSWLARAPRAVRLQPHCCHAGACSAERDAGWAAQVLEQVYLNKDTLDDDLVASIARPATAASAAEVF